MSPGGRKEGSGREKAAPSEAEAMVPAALAGEASGPSVTTGFPSLDSLLGGGLRDRDPLYHPLEHPPKLNSMQTAISPSTEAGTLPLATPWSLQCCAIVWRSRLHAASGPALSRPPWETIERLRTAATALGAGSLGAFDRGDLW